MRQHRLGGEEGAGQVDREQAIPVRAGKPMAERKAGRVDAGAGGGPVEAAEVFDGRRHRPGERVAVGDVRDGVEVGAGRRGEVDARGPPPGRTQPTDDRPAEPGGGPGDHGGGPD